MSLEDLQTMIEKHRRRANGAKYIETQREMADQLYPLLSTIVEELGEALGEIEGGLEETNEQLAGLIEATSSIVQPELALQIHGTFSIVRSLIEAVRAGADTVQIVSALEEAMTLTEAAVKEATLDEDEPEESLSEEEPVPVADVESTELPAEEVK
jgi:hypothetical protein